jgi:hypothetical protein
MHKPKKKWNSSFLLASLSRSYVVVTDGKSYNRRREHIYVYIYILLANGLEPHTKIPTYLHTWSEKIQAFDARTESILNATSYYN